MEEIIEILCKKYNLSKAQVRAITESPFRFTTEKWRQRDLGNIKYKYLGKFVVHPNKKKWLEENLIPKLKEQDELRKLEAKSRRDTGGMEERSI